MTNYACVKNIVSLEIDVSEKIDKENLKDFAFTSLKLNNKNFSKNDLIYINYIEELKQYQILLSTNAHKYLFFQIFELFYDKEIKGLDLYLGDDFFCLYKDGLFYYYQAIEISLSIDDFLEFINRKFNSKINNYIKIEKDYLGELKEKYLLKNTKTTLKNINIKNDNSFKFYLVYIFLLLFSSLYFYFNYTDFFHKEEVVINEALHFEKLKNEYLFVSVENDLNDILKNIKLYNLDLVLFEYKQNNIKLTLASKNKEDLYQFLKEYKETLISSSILFDENKKIYEMVAYAKSIK